MGDYISRQFVNELREAIRDNGLLNSMIDRFLTRESIKFLDTILKTNSINLEFNDKNVIK